MLTSAPGLPSYGLVARTAREIDLEEHGGLVVPIADPLDILSAKMAAGREKDRPHIEILCRFIEEEIVAAFETETGRRRVMPARRYLEALERSTLPPSLAARLLKLMSQPIDFRFFASVVPTQEMAMDVVRRAREAATAEDIVEAIVAARDFDRG